MKWFIMSIFTMLLVACSTTQKVEKTEPPPLYIGTVDRVFPAQNYVLIRLIGPIPQPGMTLITHAPEGPEVRTANLSVTSERVGNIRIPADIRSGSVLTGDYAFAYRKLGSAPQATDGEVQSPDSATAPEAPKTADSATSPTPLPNIPQPQSTADIPKPEWLTPADLPGKKKPQPNIGADELGDVPLRIEDEY